MPPYTIPPTRLSLFLTLKEKNFDLYIPFSEIILNFRYNKVKVRSDDMQQTYNPTWDLEVIFPGGSASKQLHTYIDNIEKEIGNLAAAVEKFTTNAPVTLEGIIDNLERTVKKLREAGAFISCLSAQNMKDEQADLLVGKGSELRSEERRVGKSV